MFSLVQAALQSTTQSPGVSNFHQMMDQNKGTKVVCSFPPHWATI